MENLGVKCIPTFKVIQSHGRQNKIYSCKIRLTTANFEPWSQCKHSSSTTFPSEKNFLTLSVTISFPSLDMRNFHVHELVDVPFILPLNTFSLPMLPIKVISKHVYQKYARK